MRQYLNRADTPHAGNGPNAGTPIVALTANVGDDERTHAFEAGMDGFLTKPYSRDQIRETLARYFDPDAPDAVEHV
jgi:CheY-like chemotaxis protein